MTGQASSRSGRPPGRRAGRVRRATGGARRRVGLVADRPHERSTRRAALLQFRIQEEGFREVLAGLPDEALNWRPGPDTNPIGVLVEHAWGAAAAWTARAVGQEIPRDRAAEFRAQRGGADLREVVARGLVRVEELLAAADPARYGESVGPARSHSRAWCLPHAVEHTSEQLGHAQLTRQLWHQRLA